jgi:hypothetical protein
MTSQALPSARMAAPEFGDQGGQSYMGASMFPFLGVCGGRIRLYLSTPGCRELLVVIRNMEISWLKTLRLLLFQPEKHTSN